MVTVTVAKAAGSVLWFDRLLTLAGTLAWPLALVLVALLFRAQWIALLHRLDELRWGDKSARFSRRLDRLERAAPFPPVLPASEDEPDLALSGDHARFFQLLELSPSAAVLDAWARVEEGLARLARRGGGEALGRGVRGQSSNSPPCAPPPRAGTWSPSPTRCASAPPPSACSTRSIWREAQSTASRSTAMPRCSSSPTQSAGSGPSSNVVNASTSSARAPISRRSMPAHTVAP